MTYEGKLRAALDCISTLSKIVSGNVSEKSIQELLDICTYHIEKNHTNLSKYTLDKKNVLSLDPAFDRLSRLSAFRVTFLSPEQIANFDIGDISKRYGVQLTKGAMYDLINDCTKLRTWCSLHGKIRMPEWQMNEFKSRDLGEGMKIIKTPIVPTLTNIVTKLSEMSMMLKQEGNDIPSEVKGIIRSLSLQAMVTITMDRCIEIICWAWDNANDVARNVVVKNVQEVQTVRVDIGNISKYYATSMAEVLSAVQKLTPDDTNKDGPASNVMDVKGFAKNLPEFLSIMQPILAFDNIHAGEEENSIIQYINTPDVYFNYRQYVLEHLPHVMDIENYFAGIDPNDVGRMFKELIHRQMYDFERLFQRTSGLPYQNETRPFARSTITEAQTAKDLFAVYADAVVKIWNKWITFNLSKPIEKKSSTTKLSVNNIPQLTRDVLAGKKNTDDEDLIVEELVTSIGEYYSKIDDQLFKIKALSEAYDVDIQNIPQSMLEDVTKIAPKGGNYGTGIKAVFKKILDFFNKFLINGLQSFTSTLDGAKKGVEWVKANKTKLIDASTRFSDEDEVTSKPYNYKAPYDRLLGIDTLSKNLLANVKDVTGKVNEVANKITPNSTADEITAAEAGVPEVDQTSIGKEIQKTYPEAVNKDLTFDANVLKSFVLFGKANKDDVADQTYTGDGCKQRYSDAVAFLTDEKIQALINGIDYNAFKTDATSLSNALKSLSDKKAAALNKKPDDQKPAENKADDKTDAPPAAEKQPEQAPPPATGEKNESLYIIDRFKAMLEADDNVQVKPDPNAKEDATGEQKTTAMEQRVAEYLRAVERLLKVTFECLQDSYVDAYNFVTMYYKILKNRAPASQTEPAPQQEPEQK